MTTSFAYDQANNLTTVTLPSGNGHVATRTFDNAGRLTTVENKKGATILSKFLWTLDAAGNPTKAQTTRGTTDTYDAYEYDSRNRLTASCYGISAEATDCAGAANTITYAYDKVSNRTQEVRSGSVPNPGTFTYTYNAADQLTQKGSTTYTYDPNGNQASGGSRTFTHDLANRLISTTNAGTTTTYTYDGDDRRVSSTVGGGGADLRHVWDPLAEAGIPELALERDPSGNLVRRYLGALSMTNTSATLYYHLDPLGTVTDLTDAAGAAQWKYEYEAYGAERSATNVSGSAPENRLRFNGQHLDPETTLYHLRARQYDPTTGRFGALDPIEPTIDAPFDGAYVYVNGRPTTGVDPLGLCLWGACDWVEDKAGDAGGWAKDKAGDAGGRVAGKTDAFLRDHVDPLLRKAATPIAGFGDAASFGLTDAIRDRMGTNYVVDKCSGWYTGGKVTGYAATAVTGTGLAGRAAGLSANLRYYSNARGVGFNIIKGTGKPSSGGWRLAFDWHRFKRGGKIVNRPHIDIRGVPRVPNKRHWPW